MTRPELHIAVAGQKNKASEYNDNFDMMMTYCEAEAQTSKDYVDSFMPTQTGNANKFLKTNGSSTSWVYVGGDFPYSGYIDGLIISRYSADTISVTAGSCFDETRTQVLILGSATTKENSSQTASTTYYVYLINNGTISDILITTESTNPTLPTGYIAYRQIGNYITNADGDIDEHNPKISNLSSSYNPSGLVESYLNGTDGYIVFTNKFCIEWGFAESTNVVGGKTVNFHNTFRDGNYIVTMGPKGTALSSAYYALEATTREQTYMKIQYRWGDCSWMVAGYLE